MHQNSSPIREKGLRVIECRAAVCLDEVLGLQARRARVCQPLRAVFYRVQGLGFSSQDPAQPKTRHSETVQLY